MIGYTNVSEHEKYQIDSPPKVNTVQTQRYEKQQYELSHAPPCQLAQSTLVSLVLPENKDDT